MSEIDLWRKVEKERIKSEIESRDPSEGAPSKVYRLPDTLAPGTGHEDLGDGKRKEYKRSQ